MIKEGNSEYMELRKNEMQKEQKYGETFHKYFLFLLGNV